MKVSRAIRILQQILDSVGDLDVAWAFEDGDSVAFMLPDRVAVLGAEDTPDFAAFTFAEVLELVEPETVNVLPVIKVGLAGDFH